MGNNFVQIKIRKDTKEKLDNIKQILKQENTDYERQYLSYDFVVHRIAKVWENLK